jgi:hypothetical protein
MLRQNRKQVFRAVLRQCERKDVGSSGDGDKLFRIDGIGHRGGADILPGIKVP